MKTDYNNINLFEVGVIGMIAVGFVIVGLILFSSLTPRQQTNIAASFDIFDIHEQVADTVNQIAQISVDVVDGQRAFYDQFYVAFTEVATLPEQTWEYPTQIAANISSVINDLSDQVAANYNQPSFIQTEIAQASEVTNYQFDGMKGKVLGATIDLGNEPQKTITTPKTFYTYSVPDFNQIKSALNKILNP